MSRARLASDEDTAAYPLQWPVSWPRARARYHAKWREEGHLLSMSAALDRLYLELERMRADRIVVSSNVRPAGYRAELTREQAQDPGAAVYFRLKGQPRVLACDKWMRTPDNIAAIAAHIAAARGQERWGVGTLDQAFAGYLALPPVAARKPWWEWLGYVQQPRSAHIDEIRARYLERIERAHPDRGGNANLAAEINAAWEEAQRELAP